MKRKRLVTFNLPAASNPSSDEIQKPQSRAKAPTHATEDPKYSLLSDSDEDANTSHVTPFDMAEELENGVQVGEDGIIPNSLSELAHREDDDPIGVNSDSDYDAQSNPEERESSPDDWVDSMDSRSIPSSRATSKPEPKEPNSKKQKNVQQNDDKDPLLSDIIPQLVCLLLPGEKATQLLRRLKNEDRIGELERATDLFQDLLGLGFFEAYAMKREQILALGDTKWSLCWGVRPGKEPCPEIHGPFSPAEMADWASAQYFVQPGKQAWVRVAGSQSPWCSAAEIFKEV